MNSRDAFIDPLSVTQMKIGEHGDILSEDQKRELYNKINATGCDAEIVEALTLSYMQMIFLEARRNKFQDADVEDSFQEYVLRILTNAKDFDPKRSNFGTYTRMQIRNIEFATRTKANRRIGRFEQVDAEVDHVTSETKDAADRCILKEDITQLRTVMTLLKRSHKNYHSVIVRYFGLGSRTPMNLKEIGDADGTSKSAASQKFRAGMAFMCNHMNSNEMKDNSIISKEDIPNPPATKIPSKITSA